MFEGLTVVPLPEEVIALLFELESLLKVVNRFAGLYFDIVNSWKTQEVVCPVTRRF